MLVEEERGDLRTSCFAHQLEKFPFRESKDAVPGVNMRDYPLKRGGRTYRWFIPTGLYMGAPLSK